MENYTTGNNTNRTQLGPDISYWEQILLAILILLIAVIGLIGNSMIITAVALSRKLQTSTNVFVTSLAVTDLMTSFFLIWFAVGVLGKKSWPIPQAYWICQLTAFAIYMFIGTSMYTLGAIAVNRLILITKPSLYRKIFTSWKLGILVAITWIVPGGAVLITLLMGNGAVGYDKTDLSCSSSHINKSAKRLFMYLVVIPIPFLTIPVSYAWIYIYLKIHFRALKKHQMAELSTSSGKSPDGDVVNMDSEANSSEQQGGSRLQMELKVEEPSPGIAACKRRREEISQQQIEITKNLFLIVCAFFACFFPFFVARQFYEQSATDFRSIFYTQLAPFANSSINFAIYARKHPDFKVVFGHMIRRSYADIPQPSRFLRYLLSKKY